MEKFGHFLKAQREKKGIHLEEIASITKINLRILKLLEESNWEELPPDPFVRGFIIAYAKYVGLEGREVTRRYLEEKNGDKTYAPVPAGSAPPAENPQEVILQSNALPVKKIALTLGVITAVIAISLVISIGKKNTNLVVQSEPKSNPKAETAAATQIFVDAPVKIPALLPPPEVKPVPELPHAPIAPTPIAQTPSPAPLPKVSQAMVSPIEPKPIPLVKALPPKISSPKQSPATTIVEKKLEEMEKSPESPTSPHEVVVESTDRSWIKIVLDDKPPRESFLSKGEKLHYSAQKKLKIVLGNAAVAKVTHNGEINKGEKLNGTIRTFIFPNGARFPQDIPRKNASVRPKPEESQEPPQD